jgi:hypothetical protein
VLQPGGAARGVVTVRSGAERVRVYASLHNLEANAGYQIVGASKACSTVDIVDFSLWRTAFRTGANDDVLRTLTRNTPTNVPLAQSVRILQRTPGGGVTQIACGDAVRRCAFPYCGGWLLPPTAAVNGIVVARTSSEETANVVSSLHGLSPNTTYVVAGARKPCSVVDAADYLFWKTRFRTSTGDDAVFAKSLTMYNTKGDPVARVMASVRVYSKSSEGLDQVACGRPITR